MSANWKGRGDGSRPRLCKNVDAVNRRAIPLRRTLTLRTNLGRCCGKQPPKGEFLLRKFGASRFYTAWTQSGSSESPLSGTRRAVSRSLPLRQGAYAEAIEERLRAAKAVVVAWSGDAVKARACGRKPTWRRGGREVRHRARPHSLDLAKGRASGFGPVDGKIFTAERRCAIVTATYGR